MPKNRQLLTVQVIVILAGTIFAWYTVIGDFIRYYNIETSIFKFNDCLAPNPLMTACFYGALAFLTAFIWSIAILRMPQEKQKMHQKRLIILLVAGTIFAWSNFTFELVKFLNAKSQPITGCSGNLVANPFNTVCFYGALFFSAGLIASLVTLKEQRKESL